MKPTTSSTSSPSQRPRSFHSPDYYPSRQDKNFRDVNLGGFVIVLLGALVAFGLVLVTQ